MNQNIAYQNTATKRWNNEKKNVKDKCTSILRSELPDGRNLSWNAFLVESCNLQCTKTLDLNWISLFSHIRCSNNFTADVVSLKHSLKHSSWPRKMKYFIFTSRSRVTSAHVNKQHNFTLRGWWRCLKEYQKHTKWWYYSKMFSKYFSV